MHSTVDDIVTGGQNAPVSLYGRKPGENFDNLAYDTNGCKKLPTQSSQIQSKNLPPTSAA